jgi:hypothetical protein
LSYFGGPVQHHPHVFLLFWGPKWQPNSQSGDDPSIYSGVQAVFHELAGTAYNNILTQYTDNTAAPNNYVHNDVSLAGVWVDPTVPNPTLGGAITWTAVMLEAEAAVSASSPSGWNAAYAQDPLDAQVIVLPQRGTTYTLDLFGDCGAHNSDDNPDLMVAIVKHYGDDAGCKGTAPTVADGMEADAVHEYAETATDPDILPNDLTPSAWGQMEGTNPWQEVADVCGQISAIYYTPANASDTIYIPSLEDNAAGSCAMTHGCEFSSPAVPYHHAVQASILDSYTLRLGASCPTPPANAANENSGSPSPIVGMPTTEQYPVGGIHAQDFQYGEVFDTGSSGAFAAYDVTNGGAYYSKWKQMGGSDGSLGTLGWPINNWIGIRGGQEQDFAGPKCGNSGGGHIYWSSASGTWEVHGCIAWYYLGTLGGPSGIVGPAGSMGFPTSDEYPVAYGRGNDFSGPKCGNSGGGHIYYSASSQAHAIYGCIASYYLSALGGPGGFLGFPMSDEYGVAGGRANQMEGTWCGSSKYGHIWFSVSTGAHETHGCIESYYVGNLGGPGGQWGFPVTDEFTNPRFGWPESDFQNGCVVWTSSGGHAYLYTDPYSIRYCD